MEPIKYINQLLEWTEENHIEDMHGIKVQIYHIKNYKSFQRDYKTKIAEKT